MPFNPNAGELQRKFERILVARVVEKSCAEQFSSVEVADFFSPDLIDPGIATAEGQLQVTQDELDFLKRNINNYLTRAKNSGLLISHGKRRGYGIASAISALESTANGTGEVVTGTSSTSAPVHRGPSEVRSRVEAGRVAGSGREHRESFLHLPFTLGLMQNFLESEAIVYSLPRVVSHSGMYSNPDALMIRKNELTRRREDLFDRWQELNLGPSDDLRTLMHQFERIPTAPLIVSSLEYKFFYQKDPKALRRDLTAALIEAQMNSSWANESWLVYYVDGASSQHRPDADVTKLAESMGVGLLQAIDRDGEFELVDWVAPRFRESLDLHNGHVDLLLSLKESLAHYQKIQAEEAFHDDAKSAHMQSLQTMRNLFRQDGFTAQPEQGIQTMRNAYAGLVRATRELLNSLSLSEDSNWFRTDLVRLMKTYLPQVDHATHRLDDVQKCFDALAEGPSVASSAPSSTPSSSTSWTKVS